MQRLAKLVNGTLGDFEVPRELPEVVHVYKYPENVPVWVEGQPQLGVWPFLTEKFATINDARKAGQAANTANCKIETMFDVWTWKESARSRRCVIPVSGYNESQHRYRVGPRGGKIDVSVPYRFHRPNGEPMMLAGLWAYWYGKITYAVVTREPDALHLRYHNSNSREPVTLRNDDEIVRWLTPGSRETIEDLYLPRDDGFLVASETEGLDGRRVENPPPEFPAKEPNQGLLF